MSHQVVWCTTCFIFLFWQNIYIQNQSEYINPTSYNIILASNCHFSIPPPYRRQAARESRRRSHPPPPLLLFSPENFPQTHFQTYFSSPYFPLMSKKVQPRIVTFLPPVSHSRNPKMLIFISILIIPNADACSPSGKTFWPLISDDDSQLGKPSAFCFRCLTGLQTKHILLLVVPSNEKIVPLICLW